MLTICYTNAVFIIAVTFVLPFFKNTRTGQGQYIDINLKSTLSTIIITPVEKLTVFSMVCKHFITKTVFYGNFWFLFNFPQTLFQKVYKNQNKIEIALRKYSNH